ncbi:MAG: cytochrome c maturation protein CcmE [Parvularculaceae bacterium]
MTKKQRRLLFAGAIVSVAAVAAALVLTALKSSVAYFYTPSDLQKLAQLPTGMVRLGGLVETGSVKFADAADTKSRDALVDFVIEDTVAKTPVTYRGVLPDLFREGQGVVVEGKFDASGELVASQVLAKHDENYMPKEVADALKKQGVWQETEGPTN